MDKYNILKNSELFCDLNDSCLHAIASISEFITYKKNNIVFLNGDKATHIYIVLEGHIKVYKTSFRGDETIIRISGPKQIFGEISCLTKQYHTLSSQALNNTSILKIPQKELLKAIKIDENYNDKIQTYLSKRYFKVISNFEKSLILNIEEKLAALILNISKDYTDKKTFALPYSKRIIASQLSTNPETISRSFKVLEKKGFICIQNKDITILNKKALELLCDI